MLTIQTLFISVLPENFDKAESSLHLIEIHYDPFSELNSGMTSLNMRRAILRNENKAPKCQAIRVERTWDILFTLSC